MVFSCRKKGSMSLYSNCSQHHKFGLHLLIIGRGTLGGRKEEEKEGRERALEI
jgi:hypothetical protein